VVESGHHVPKSEHNARMHSAEEFGHETMLPGKRNGMLGAIPVSALRAQKVAVRLTKI
jgi:hypothetical protein